MLRLLLATTAAAAALATAAHADEAAVEVAPLTVVGRTPVAGAEVDRDRAPGAVDVVTDEAIRTGAGSRLLNALELRVPGVALVNAQANPYQPSLTYRGFEASPLQGVAQGVAVYVDGVRFNQPFGDTVNWDLIPEAALSSLAIEGSNPVFGLNAVGGSLSVRLKTGFTDAGGVAELSAGSFGAVRGTLEYGAHSGGLAVYGALTGLEEDGWRDVSPTRLRQLYADVGLRRGAFQGHLGVIAADNRLTGNGPAPVELLAADRRAVFTQPDVTGNRFALVRSSGAWALSDRLSVQGQGYVGRLRQATANGDASDAEPCDDDEAVLCLDDDGPRLTTTGGAPIAAFLGEGAAHAQLNTTRTRTTALGAALQLVSKASLGGLPNTLTVGAALDHGRTRFRAASELGALSADRGFEGPGILIDQTGGPIAPVELSTRNTYAGLYVLDLLELTPEATLTLSARYNRADVRLIDRRGTALNGDHGFSRLNPAAGVTYALPLGATAYAGWARTNRAPTPAELSCADPQAPCSLTNFFLADPPLKQVRAESFEAGLRGRGETFRWSLGVFRTTTRDDIALVASEFRGRGFFRNVGRTRRQGLEAQAALAAGAVSAATSYAFTDAEFRSPLVLNSPASPAADEDGLIFVERGDRLPSIARHRFKLDLDYDPGPWRVGLSVVASSGRPLVGDEAGLQPSTGGYAVANLHASWRLSDRAELFAAVENVTDEAYETFGTFAFTDEVELEEAPGASDPRSLSPAPPRSVTVGVRVRF
jgi:iron complex outermembrane recepter protein